MAGSDSIPLLAGLDLERICASSGSACSAGSLEPSHVVEALGVLLVGDPLEHTVVDEPGQPGGQAVDQDRVVCGADHAGQVSGLKGGPQLRAAGLMARETLDASSRVRSVKGN